MTNTNSSGFAVNATIAMFVGYGGEEREIFAYGVTPGSTAGGMLEMYRRFYQDTALAEVVLINEVSWKMF